MASKVKSSSIKVLDVSERLPIKKFLAKEKLPFVKGNAFYQLTKGEIIQDYKKLIVLRNSDQTPITGDNVRTALKIPKDKPDKFKLDFSTIPDFSVFVQSTSHNRVLLPGTKMIYQLGDDIIEDDDDKIEEEKEEEEISTTRRSTRNRKTTTAIASGTSKTKADPKAAKKNTATKRRKEADDTETTSKPKKVGKVDDGASAMVDSNPPAGPTEISFSFDTTGSMYACLAEVRLKLQQTITRLKSDIPGIKMAVIAHGDYCDSYTYVTKICDFTDDVNKLCKFVKDVECTGGGDFDECYELVLREAHSKLSWSKDSQKSLVVIGDATPHEPGYPLNNLNWIGGRSVTL